MLIPGTKINPLKSGLFLANSRKSSSTIFDLPAAVGNTIKNALIPAALLFWISCKLIDWCSYNSTDLSIFKPLSIKLDGSFPKYCLISSSMRFLNAQSSVEKRNNLIPYEAHVFCFLNWFLYFSSPMI